MGVQRTGQVAGCGVRISSISAPARTAAGSVRRTPQARGRRSPPPGHRGRTAVYAHIAACYDLHMAVLTQRLQLLLDEDRFARLAQEAERRGSSVASLVREAIDATFPPNGPSRSAAAELLLGAEPIRIDGWNETKAEIEQMYEGGA